MRKLSTYDRTSVAICIGIAVLVRVALAVVLRVVTHAHEISDDYFYYSAFLRNPLMLVTGFGASEIGDGGIYAPLIGPQIWLLCKPLSMLFGVFLSLRLTMITYDAAGLAIGLTVAVKLFGSPRTAKQWAAFISLALVPASVLASAVWTQEDSICSLWAGLSLLTLLTIGPAAAVAVAGVGLFSSKLFVVVLMMAIWAGSPGRRLQCAASGAALCIAYGLFLLLRFKISGYVPPNYRYVAPINSPSIGAIVSLIHGPVDVELLARLTTVIGGLTLITAAATIIYLRIRPVTAVVLTHAAFFSLFIGIQPEHYEWWMPFLVVVSWGAWRYGRPWFATGLWLSSGLAYLYKITYGISSSLGAASSSAEKNRLLTLIITHLHISPSMLRLSLVPLAMLIMLLLLALAVRAAGKDLAQLESLPITTSDGAEPPGTLS